MARWRERGVKKGEKNERDERDTERTETQGREKTETKKERKRRNEGMTEMHVVQDRVCNHSKTKILDHIFVGTV